MDNSQRRQISIVIRVEGQRMSGLWRNSGEEASREITINGETSFPWRRREDVWRGIAANLQLDLEREACRLLVYSDQPIDEADLPPWKGGWSWELKEIAQAIEREAPIGRWYVNGVDLNGRYAKTFPAADGKRGDACYICTIPPFAVPEAPDGLTPLGEIIQELNRRQSGRSA